MPDKAVRLGPATTAGPSRSPRGSTSSPAAKRADRSTKLERLPHQYGRSMLAALSRRSGETARATCPLRKRPSPHRPGLPRRDRAGKDLSDEGQYYAARRSVALSLNPPRLPDSRERSSRRGGCPVRRGTSGGGGPGVDSYTVSVVVSSLVAALRRRVRSRSIAIARLARPW